MIKKSKIKEVVDVKGDGRKWSGTYFYNLIMENGDKINIGKKSYQLKPGTELTYEIIGDPGQHEYTKAKSALGMSTEAAPVANKQDYQKGIEVGHAVNNAVNMICAGVNFNIISYDSGSNDETESKIKAYAKKILKISKELKDEI